jgi:hypothetical protein
MLKTKVMAAEPPVLYFDRLLDASGRPTSPPIYRVRTCARELGTVERRGNFFGRDLLWIASGMAEAHVPGRRTRRAAAEWLLEWSRQQEKAQ